MSVRVSAVREIRRDQYAPGVPSRHHVHVGLAGSEEDERGKEEEDELGQVVLGGEQLKQGDGRAGCV